MNNDLISRKTALSIVERNAFHEGREWVFRGRIMRELEKATAVDAEPVRHGRWIEYTYWIGSFGQIHTKCSECGTDYPCRKGGRGDGKGGKFCEECGAKMDGEADGQHN